MLLGLSAVSTGFAAVLGLAMAFGGTGIAVPALALFMLCAASGALLLTPAVRGLARPYA